MTHQNGDSGARGAVPQWGEERRFFDEAAAAAGEFELATVSARYEASLAEPLYPLETAYALLGPIRGRRVLDVGCGHGEHSLLFAHWGAVVTGVDISEGAVAVCRRRAQSLGLSEATTFVNSPFEALTQTEQRFDIVWTCAFLHHVLDRLESVIQLFDRLLLPGGTILFMEPVRLSPWVKTARRLVPLPAAGTPDERPLERGDLATIDNVFEFHDSRYFGPVSRIVDRCGLSDGYETAPAARRGMSDAGYRLDRAIMRMPPLRSAAMIMVARLTRRVP